MRDDLRRANHQRSENIKKTFAPTGLLNMKHLNQTEHKNSVSRDKECPASGDGERRLN